MGKEGGRESAPPSLAQLLSRPNSLAPLPRRGRVKALARTRPLPCLEQSRAAAQSQSALKLSPNAGFGLLQILDQGRGQHARLSFENSPIARITLRHRLLHLRLDLPSLYLTHQPRPVRQVPPVLGLRVEQQVAPVDRVRLARQGQALARERARVDECTLREGVKVSEGWGERVGG